MKVSPFMAGGSQDSVIVFFMLSFHAYVMLNDINLEDWRDKVMYITRRTRHSLVNAKYEVENLVRD